MPTIRLENVDFALDERKQGLCDHYSKQAYSTLTRSKHMRMQSCFRYDSNEISFKQKINFTNYEMTVLPQLLESPEPLYLYRVKIGRNQENRSEQRFEE